MAGRGKEEGEQVLIPGDAILTAPGMPFEMVEMDIEGRRMRAWKNVSGEDVGAHTARCRRAKMQAWRKASLWR